MPDWDSLRALGSTAWDWASKIGLGAGGFWLFRRWLDKRDKVLQRGRNLVDAARPELIPQGNRGDRHTICIEVRNDGIGPARTLTLGFSGDQIQTVDNVPVGQSRLTGSLNVRHAPFFNDMENAQAGQASITLRYADRYGNEYDLTIPVTRQSRADGEFSMGIDWHHYHNTAYKPSNAKLREIGAT